MSQRLSDYDYHLPEELIAQTPVHPRDSSRLMVLHRRTGEIEHRRFRDLPEYLDNRDMVVANNTRVIKARLLGHRPGTGGRVEFLMLEELSPCVWEGAFHASAKYLPGVKFEIPTPDGLGLRGELIRGAAESPSGTVVARFDRDPVASGAGEIPLPHYIHRDHANDHDSENYQTVYARHQGSAAAPTAGLHFTPDVMQRLKLRDVKWEEITLHVGLGTFRPVKTEDIREHVMHDERYEISEATARAIQTHKASGGRIVAVGTTSVRTLESAAILGEGEVLGGCHRTSIFIYPDGFQFKVVDRIVTNFHLPKSTLLMLISAFAGREKVLEAYREAVRERYRFFSYGDSMLILG